MALPHLLAFQFLAFTFQSLTLQSLTLSLHAHQLIALSLYTFPFNAQLFLLTKKIRNLFFTISKHTATLQAQHT
jgi:hypothetical protein